jgi:hypothetical protein
MNKTKIESSIMEMIEPKANDIRQRFSRGEKLSLQDFNLLLLKTQYNHLNHLEIKLDEVVADVSDLKSEFNHFKSEINLRFDKFATEINLKLEVFKNEIEFKIQKAINVNMRWSIGIIAFIVTILKIIDMILK